MLWSSSSSRTTVLKVAAKIAVLLLVFGLAECAAGSCLSYGHSCWGAHGKRNGGSAAELPDDGNEAVAAVATPEDTRWFLSRLVEPGSESRMWQRPSLIDRRHKNAQWKGEEAEGVADIRENDGISRSRTALHIEGSDESSSDILVPASGEFPEENQDGEVLLMADDPSSRRLPQKLRIYKIMNHQGRKLDK